MIEIKDISKSFGKQTVLSDLSLQIKKGNIYSLIGNNGAGKTTLINIISGILNPDRGKVIIDDETINESSFKFKKNIGCVFEKPFYIERYTPLEYMYMLAEMYDIPKEQRKKKINKLIETFQLNEHKNKFICDSSKGIKKKISIISALLHDPKYLLLDEPFDGIDYTSLPVIFEILQDHCKNGGAVLITSHRIMEVFEISDYICVMKNGTLKENKNKAKLDSNSLRKHWDKLIENNS